MSTIFIQTSTFGVLWLGEVSLSDWEGSDVTTRMKQEHCEFKASQGYLVKKQKQMKTIP